MAEIKQLKGLQIGDNIYSQIDDAVEDDPELTWSGHKITQRAYLKEKQEGTSITITSSNLGTITVYNKNSSFLKLYANTRYSYEPGYTKAKDGSASLNKESSWVTQPTGAYITIPSLKNTTSNIYLYMNAWPESSTYGATVFYDGGKTKISAFNKPEDSTEKTVAIPSESSLFRFTYSRVEYAPDSIKDNPTTPEQATIDAAPYIQFYIKEIPPESYESYITIEGLMPLTSYTITVGNSGETISYNTDPIGENFIRIENQIGEGFSETNTVKDQIDQINGTIGSKTLTDFENKTLWQVLEELSGRIATLESYRPAEEPETSETT